MSTKIDDLPVPMLEETKTETITEKQKPIIINEEKEKPKEIHVTEKKFSLFNLVKKEINEENLFLLILFFILSLNNTNRYFSNLPYIGSVFEESSFSFLALKSFIFLIVFIFVKSYFLPKIQI